MHDVPPTPLAPCPPEGDLRAFAEGGLAQPALEAIGAHLADCTRCVGTLGRIDGESAGSDLAGLLRATDPDPFALDPEYVRMVEKASRILAHPPAPSAPPPRLGQYEIHERIGRGGMGTVYRARHLHLKRWVAIKVLPQERTADPRAVARFEREMEAVGRLDHASIVRATDAGEVDGVHFLAMELIDGIDLARLVKARGPLAVGDACELARQAAEGLQVAHAAGLVHRDVKPSNLMVTADGRVKLLDLGLTLLRDHGTGLTASGDVMGTGDYMAPEQWDAATAVDIRADLYSLGCTLHTLLTGRPPFGTAEYDTMPRKMAAHARVPVPSIRAIRPDVPAGLATVIERLLAKQPADRYPTPAEAAAALAPFCAPADLPALGRIRAAESDHPDCSTLPLLTNRTPVPAPPRHRWRWVAAAAAVLVLVGASALVRDLTRPAATTAGGAVAADLPPPAVVAAGLKPKVWTNLLQRPVNEFYWTNPRGMNTWKMDAEGQWLQATTSNYGLLSLGRVDTPGFSLQLAVRQNGWVGRFGIFYAGHRLSENPTTRSFELVEMTSTFQLSRQRGWIGPNTTGGVVRDLRPMALNARPDAPGNYDVLFRIDVMPRAGVFVHWRNAEYRELGDVLVKPANPDYRGEFGLYCDNCTVLVTSAQCMPLE